MPPPSIPLLYRLLFLYFEPFADLGGVYLTLTQPALYLSIYIPNMPSTAYTPFMQPIFAQLAGLLTLFAWSQAIVLRVTSDVNVWKAVLSGMVLCDSLHLYGMWAVLGTEVFLDLRRWRLEEWINFVMLYGPGGMRLAFCAGLGLGDGKTMKRI